MTQKNEDICPLSILSGRINLSDIRNIVKWSAGNEANLDLIRQLVNSEDRKTSVNALWVLSHLPDTEKRWLCSHQDEFIDMLLRESDSSKKRILLQVLKKQEFNPDCMRTDLLDFCLSKINSECEPYAVRAFSIYVAFNMCKHYPELTAELNEHLTMLSFQDNSPGLASARRKTFAAIKKLKALHSSVFE